MHNFEINLNESSNKFFDTTKYLNKITKICSLVISSIISDSISESNSNELLNNDKFYYIKKEKLLNIDYYTKNTLNKINYTEIEFKSIVNKINNYKINFCRDTFYGILSKIIKALSIMEVKSLNIVYSFIKKLNLINIEDTNSLTEYNVFYENFIKNYNSNIYNKYTKLKDNENTANSTQIYKDKEFTIDNKKETQHQTSISSNKHNYANYNISLKSNNTKKLEILNYSKSNLMNNELNNIKQTNSKLNNDIQISDTTTASNTTRNRSNSTKKLLLKSVNYNKDINYYNKPANFNSNIFSNETDNINNNNNNINLLNSIKKNNISDKIFLFDPISLAKYNYNLKEKEIV